MTTNDAAQGIRHRVLEEEAAWEQAAESILGAEAELVSVSRHIGDSRVYRRGERLAKIRSLGVALPSGVTTLAAEAEVLKRLGHDATYATADSREALLFPRIDGLPLDQVLPSLSPVARARLLLRLVPELRRLHARGVAHRDLRLDNVLVDADGRPRLIDFDRATVNGTWSAGLADAFGIAPSGLSANPYWKLALFTLAPKTQSLARRLRALVMGPSSPRNGLSAEPDLQLLARAWSLAERSPANAPGQRVAYYAFTYKGHHFAGERPWYLRWESIRSAVSFGGKRLIELGSNMGLLSSFAMIHGATAATGVDYDQSIVDAARLVAEGLGTEANFERVDLVGDPAWEAKLAGGDIVVAMSLLHWLPDADRVLRFLGTHREVIFEGHDPLDVEIAKLRSVGFENVSIIGKTERGRSVLFGRRQ